MKTLAKYHVGNYGVIGEKTFKNILIGPGKLLGLSRNGPLVRFAGLVDLHSSARNAPIKVRKISGW